MLPICQGAGKKLSRTLTEGDFVNSQWNVLILQKTALLLPSERFRTSSLCDSSYYDNNIWQKGGISAIFS